jgi:D-alanyl-D-alanine carboxypeptidase/D-alanyl-D-alanine-endopeptidase (penicillin-binding protein 4)
VRFRGAVIAGLLAVLASGCGSGSGHASAPPGGAPRTATAATATAATATQSARPTASVTAPQPPLPPPRGGRFELNQAFHHWFAAAGPLSGAYVYDLTTHRAVYSLRPSIGRPPASVEKLYTTVAALTRLGPANRLHTVVYGTGALDSRGVWRGDLYLRGNGDPTFGSAAFDKVWAGGVGSTVEDLAAQLIRGAGIRRVTGHVFADASRFDGRPGTPSSDFKPDVSNLGGELSALTYNHGVSTKVSPAVFAAQQLAANLRRAKVKVNASLLAVGTPPGARRLASVSSPPLATLLRLMDVPSDDFYAELLAKQLGARFAGAGSTAAGANVIAQTMSLYGINPTVIDGSGLSRANRSSPIEVVRLLQAVWKTDIGRVLVRSLPVVGVSGTVRRIAAGTQAAGRCIAKTGTLDAVTNLAGYCAARGGQQLAFALFIDGPTNTRALELMNRIVLEMVRLDVTRP